jgi:hypothetical protein
VGHECGCRMKRQACPAGSAASARETAEIVDLGAVRRLAALDALRDILLTDPGVWDDDDLLEIAHDLGLAEVFGGEWRQRMNVARVVGRGGRAETPAATLRRLKKLPHAEFVIVVGAMLAARRAELAAELAVSRQKPPRRSSRFA